MFPLSAQNNFYIILSSYGEWHVKKKSRQSFISLVGFQPPKSGYLFGKFTAEQVLKSFSGRNIPCNPLFLDFLIVFYMFWKNQESWEPWLVGFWVNKNSKIQKMQCFCLWPAIMDLLITLRYWILFFLISYQEEFPTLALQET